MIDRIQNSQKNFGKEINIDFGKINQDLASKPLFGQNDKFSQERTDSLKSSIGQLQESILAERDNGKNSVNYDFSNFNKKQDSDLKFL